MNSSSAEPASTASSQRASALHSRFPWKMQATRNMFILHRRLQMTGKRPPRGFLERLQRRAARLQQEESCSVRACCLRALTEDLRVVFLGFSRNGRYLLGYETVPHTEATLLRVYRLRTSGPKPTLVPVVRHVLFNGERLSRPYLVLSQTNDDSIVIVATGTCSGESRPCFVEMVYWPFGRLASASHAVIQPQCVPFSILMKYSLQRPHPLHLPATGAANDHVVCINTESSLFVLRVEFLEPTSLMSDSKSPSAGVGDENSPGQHQHGPIPNAARDSAVDRMSHTTSTVSGRSHHFQLACSSWKHVEEKTSRRAFRFLPRASRSQPTQELPRMLPVITVQSGGTPWHACKAIQVTLEELRLDKFVRSLQFPKLLVVSDYDARLVHFDVSRGAVVFVCRVQATRGSADIVATWQLDSGNVSLHWQQETLRRSSLFGQAKLQPISALVKSIRDKLTPAGASVHAVSNRMVLSRKSLPFLLNPRLPIVITLN